MKAILVGAVVATLAMIFLQYRRGKDTKKLLLSLFSFVAVLSLAVAGNLTRSVPPIFIAHLVLLIAAWGGLLWHILRGRYYWWLIVSPVVTIAIFLVMELLMGSGHEYFGGLQ